MGETIKTFQEGFGESDKSDEPKNLFACDSESSSNKDLYGPGDVGSLSDNNSSGESLPYVYDIFPYLGAVEKKQ